MKQSIRNQVIRFCRDHGIALNADHGIPLMTKGTWMYVADDWNDAYKTLKHIVYSDTHASWSGSTTSLPSIGKVKV